MVHVKFVKLCDLKRILLVMFQRLQIVYYFELCLISIFKHLSVHMCFRWIRRKSRLMRARWSSATPRNQNHFRSTTTTTTKLLAFQNVFEITERVCFKQRWQKTISLALHNPFAYVLSREWMAWQWHHPECRWFLYATIFPDIFSHPNWTKKRSQLKQMCYVTIKQFRREAQPSQYQPFPSNANAPLINACYIIATCLRLHLSSLAFD